MKRTVCATFAALLLLLGSSAIPAVASQGPAHESPVLLGVRAPTPRHQAIPRALYPPHSNLHYFASITNLQMDCNWGMDCLTGARLFHLTSQDDLGRLGGWEQDGQHGKTVFMLFASTYDTVGHAQDALLDVRNAMSARAMTIEPQTPGSFVQGQISQGHGRIVVLAYVRGAAEVEAGVLTTTSNRRAEQYLLRQVSYALGAGSAAGPRR